MRCLCPVVLSFMGGGYLSPRGVFLIGGLILRNAVTKDLKRSFLALLVRMRGRMSKSTLTPQIIEAPAGFAVSLLEEGLVKSEGQGLSVEHSRSSRFGQGKTHDTQEKGKRSKSTRICHGRGGRCSCCNRNEHLRVPVRTGHPTDDSNGIPKRIMKPLKKSTVSP